MNRRDFLKSFSIGVGGLWLPNAYAARSFDGTMDLEIASAVATATPITMVCWFQAVNTTALHYLITIGRTNATGQYFALNANGSVAGDPIRATSVFNGTIRNASTSTSFVANTWQHAAAVFTSSTLRDAYLNAGGAGTDTVSSVPSGVNVTTIGAANINSVKTSPLNGQLADVAIYSAALTVAEITSLFRGFRPPQVRPQSLLLYMPLVRNIQDLRQGATITATGTTTVTTHPRIIF